MSLAVLELNDQNLLMQSAGGPLFAEPGFAHLGDRGIETGEAARAMALREPQHSYNQYWSQLNESPLPIKSPWARHHADIAFTQLRHMWHDAGAPESLILLPPGSFTEAQLSLLLGMVEALPASTQALVDDALAACLGIEEATLFVDLQLHQSVLTVCRPRGPSVEISEQEVFADLGLMQILNAVARHISDLVIASHRHDPLHDPDSEQAVFDLIPAWLQRLGWEEEIAATLRSGQGEFPIIVRREAVKGLIGERLVNARSFAARHAECRTVLSHGAGLLLGLTDEFATAEVAGQTVAVANCLARADALVNEAGGGLHRLRSLVRAGLDADHREPEVRLATHLCYRDVAVPLGKPVSIRLGDRGIGLANAVDRQAALTVVMRNGSLHALHSAPDADLCLPSCPRPGEVIRVEGHELRLIEVRDG